MYIRFTMKDIYLQHSHNDNKYLMNDLKNTTPLVSLTVQKQEISARERALCQLTLWLVAITWINITH